MVTEIRGGPKPRHLQAKQLLFTIVQTPLIEVNYRKVAGRRAIEYPHHAEFIIDFMRHRSST